MFCAGAPYLFGILASDWEHWDRPPVAKRTVISPLKHASTASMTPLRDALTAASFTTNAPPQSWNLPALDPHDGTNLMSMVRGDASLIKKASR